VVASAPPLGARRRGLTERLLVIGAGAAQLGLLEAAREHDVFTIAVDRDPSAPGFRFASRRAIISAEDELGIERLAVAEQVDGLIAPGIDFPVAIAARIAARLGVPHPLSPEAAVLATSKLRQRARLAEAGVPQPRYAVAPTLVEARAAAGEIGYPLVVKPPDRQGQKGLALARTPAELDTAFETALGASRGGLVLLERLVDGPEVTVVAFSVGGRFVPLTVTDRVVAEPPAFGVALAHVWAREAANDTVLLAAVEAARAAAEALGVTDGPTYTQLRLAPDGPRVGELAARLGGGHDAELCLAALGVDLNGLALAAALGRPIEEPTPEPRVGGACTLFLVPPAGVIDAVSGVEEAAALEGVVGVRIYREPGSVQSELRRGADRAGGVIAVGDSREQALERARRAADLVRFETVDAASYV
jgi:biotin carboxylase